MDSCLICAEDFNASTHSEVNCPYCSFSACRTCCQTYILDQESNVCMNMEKKSDGTFVCRKTWPRKFVVDTFPDSWIKGKWRKMIEKVGFEREKALLPATMPELTRRKEVQKVQNEVDQIDKEIHALWLKKREVQRRLVQAEENTNNENQERVSRGRPCANEECRGYLSSQWKCGVCDMWTCPDCHQLKGLTRDAHHVCNPDDVATANLLNKDTKPCPSCSTPIHKLMGCDQMWCTQCHTGFSWKTGAIQSRIHNPHFFEWQRQNNNGDAPRRVGDIECGRDLGDSRALMSIRKIFRSLRAYADQDELPEKVKFLKRKEFIFETIVRGTIHLDHVQSHRFRTDQIVNNQDIRINYLDKKITEKKFKSDILRRDKAYEKKQDIFNVIQLAIRAVTDIIYRFESNLKKNQNEYFAQDPQPPFQNTLPLFENNINDALLEIKNITDYCNNLLSEHSKTYDCKKYQFNFISKSNLYSNDVLV